MRALAVVLSLAAVAGCDDLANDSADGGDSGACGASTCSATQICLYRECTAQERCRPSTTCAANETPSSCNGQPGCLVAQCGPVIQGCRDVPASCSGDVTCACGSICGSPSACKQVDGRNALCAAP